MERYTNGELTSADSIKVADSLKFVTPKGKVVYGGGGIIPDVFVPIGSNQEEAIESMDDTYQFFARFVFEHLEEDRTMYDGYTQNQFLDEFRVDDILFDNFIQFVLDRKIKLDFYAYEDKIKAYLKANIAEQLFSPNISAQIKGDHDSMLKKVRALDKAEIDQSQIGAVEVKH